MTFFRTALVLLFTGQFVVGCATPVETTDVCSGSLRGSLDAAMQDAENRLTGGCSYEFDRYVGELLVMAEANPDRRNPQHFSEFLVRLTEEGVISRRKAEDVYNRYFNVKFVSLQGDYNTCSQTCPVKSRVLSAMQSELKDKELGLLRASNDAAGFYRADHLLKETELVLEATCRACVAGVAR